MKLLLIDENILLGKSLEIALKEHPKVAAFKFISTINGLNHVMTNSQPDIVVIESKTKKWDGLLLGKCLIKKFAVKVVFMSRDQHHIMQRKAFKIGANGCMSKDVGLDLFIKILLDVHLTNRFYFPTIKEKVAITAREQDILILLAKGYRQIDIGDTLGISERTVRNHVYAINDKFETTTILHSVVKAIKLGIIDISQDH